MTETVSSLEQKLSEKARSFPDQSMRFLFLINNSHFIWQQLYPTAASILEPHMSGLARKVDNYIETYLQMAWAPVLSCLYNYVHTYRWPNGRPGPARPGPVLARPALARPCWRAVPCRPTCHLIGPGPAWVWLMRAVPAQQPAC
jgi:hypothetical protein